MKNLKWILLVLLIVALIPVLPSPWPHPGAQQEWEHALLAVVGTGYYLGMLALWGAGAWLVWKLGKLSYFGLNKFERWLRQ